jgi:acetate kinase
MILVINSGSSSIKYKLFSYDLKLVFSSIIEEVTDFHQGFANIFDTLLQSDSIQKMDDIKIVAHRVVHGGEKFIDATLIDEEVINELKKLIPLAPLHNPSNIEGIEISQKQIPLAKQIAVFDTAFHNTIPKHAFMYPLPFELYEKEGIRRYGFHGTSHKYVANECAKQLEKKLEDLNLITIHLGNGDSITAIKNGKSIDTSMGFTPSEGLMMGTRAGDIDSEIVLYLENQLGMGSDEIDIILNKESGFKGITGKSDLRAIKEDAKQGDEKALLGIDMFCYRVKKYIGSYKEILGRVDAIVFTGGIGENAPYIREKIIGENKDNLKIFVIPTNEELQIALESKEFIDSNIK